MRWKEKKNSLFYKIFILILLTSMIPLILVNYIWMNNTKKIVCENEIQMADSVLYQMTMRMENMMNFVNVNTYSFLFDAKARQIISTKPANDGVRKENEIYLHEIFSQIKKSNTMIRSVEFVGNYYQVSSEDDMDGNVDYNELKAQEWYQEFCDYYLETVTPVYQNSYIKKMNTEVFGWIRKMSPSNSNTTVGNFLVEISQSSVANLIEKVQEDTGNPVIVYDKKGNLIYHPEGRYDANKSEKAIFDKAKTEKQFSVSDEKDTYTCLVKKVSTPDWYAVMLVDQQELLMYGKKSTMESMCLEIMIVFVSIAVAYLISGNITKPVKQLAKTMELVEQNKLDVSMPVNQKVTEVVILSRCFNNMLSHIRQLLNDVRREEQEKKELEIKMLQAQINPHFLYNTLNVIRWKAMMHGETSISNMIISLIKLLEFSGKRVDTYVTIEKEREHATSYLNLIKEQYQDEFEVEYKVDEAVLQCYTVKFILQPLIENAVFHGLEPLDEKGKILIEISGNHSWIYFKVEDNGIGMSEEVYNNQSAFRGLGIYNVNERLRKHFGKESTLHIESEEGIGTCVTFRIPVLTCAPDKGKGEKNEEGTSGR